MAAALFIDGIPAVAQRLMAAHWPGPLTLVFKRREGVAGGAAGGHATIALRCPSHPAALNLLTQCLALGVPGLAAPSANRFGRVSPTTADHVLSEFGHSVMVLDGGSCSVGIESAIVDVSRANPVLLRPGVLPLAVLSASAGVEIALAEGDAQAPAASGTLQAHYAPHAKLRLMSASMLRDALSVLGADGMLTLAADGMPSLAVYARSVTPPNQRTRFKRMPDTAEAAAHELFSVLRELDDAGATLIWVERPPADPAWHGVLDRLTRAAAAST